jgi:hypothetical protein
MAMTKTYLLTFLATMTIFHSWSQEARLNKSHSLSVKSETIYSDITLKRIGPQSIPTSSAYHLGRIGYTFGLVYSNNFNNNRYSFLCDVNFLSRGFATRSFLGNTITSTNRYHYIAFTPAMGYSPLKFLTLSAGPSFNLLISKETVADGAQSLEVGLVSRASFSTKNLSILVSYFHPLNFFDSMTTQSGSKYSLTDRQWRVGIAYPIRHF